MGSGRLTPQLVVAGNFTHAGGMAVNFIARWNGAAWQPFATGFDDWVNAVITFDPDGAGPASAALYAGGYFTFAGDRAVFGIARWSPNENAWLSVNFGVDGDVYALATVDLDGAGARPLQLVAGGSFTFAGIEQVNKVAILEEGEWAPLGLGFLDGVVYSLTSWDSDGAGPSTPRVVVGGVLSRAFNGAMNSVAVRNIASWNGTAWQSLGTGTDSWVTALTAADLDGAGPNPARLVAGGFFTSAGGVPAARVARWDGGGWQPVGVGMNSNVSSLATWDSDGAGPLPAQLVAGGSFTTAGNSAASRVARWDGAEWQAFGSGIGNGDVLALTTWDPDASGPLPVQLVAAGRFTNPTSAASGSLATWSTSNPSAPVLLCVADHDKTGSVTPQDVFAYLSSYFSGEAAADVDGVVGLSVQDVFVFLARFFDGC